MVNKRSNFSQFTDGKNYGGIEDRDTRTGNVRIINRRDREDRGARKGGRASFQRAGKIKKDYGKIAKNNRWEEDR